MTGLFCICIMHSNSACKLLTSRFHAFINILSYSFNHWRLQNNYKRFFNCTLLIFRIRSFKVLLGGRYNRMWENSGIRNGGKVKMCNTPFTWNKCIINYLSSNLKHSNLIEFILEPGNYSSHQLSSLSLPFFPFTHLTIPEFDFIQFPILHNI